MWFDTLDNSNIMVIYAIEEDCTRKLHWKYAFRMVNYITIYLWYHFYSCTLYDSMVFYLRNRIIKIKLGHLLVPQECSQNTLMLSHIVRYIHRYYSNINLSEIPSYSHKWRQSRSCSLICKNLINNDNIALTCYDT